MAKKRQDSRHSRPRPAATEGPATLKDLLSSEVLGKLKEQADQLKAEEQSRKEAERQAAEEKRLAEKKRLENDFAHLLANSKEDWRKFK